MRRCTPSEPRHARGASKSGANVVTFGLFADSTDGPEFTPPRHWLGIAAGSLIIEDQFGIGVAEPMQTSCDSEPARPVASSAFVNRPVGAFPRNSPIPPRMTVVERPWNILGPPPPPAPPRPPPPRPPPPPPNPPPWPWAPCWPLLRLVVSPGARTGTGGKPSVQVNPIRGLRCVPDGKVLVLRPNSVSMSGLYAGRPSNRVPSPRTPYTIWKARDTR